jgi:hypothetical protein
MSENDWKAMIDGKCQPFQCQPLRKASFLDRTIEQEKALLGLRVVWAEFDI